MKMEYYSLHARLIDDFIAFKRSLGFKYKMEYTFKDFDRFLAENRIDEIGLSRTTYELWAVKRPNESDSTRYRRVHIIRGYSSYLNRLGYRSYVGRQIKHRKTTFTPYIFTKEEISAIFEACDNTPINVWSRSMHIYPALFRLLYGCGLRISEALSLVYGDVDLDKKYVVLRETKNGDERILPMSETVTAALSVYNDRWRAPAGQQDLFFVNKYGNKCNSNTAYRYFRGILRKAGISHGGRRLGPCLHSFRHTFSVHSLANMAQAGLDLYYCLPILSKYLGHKSLEATEGYVRLTEEMYPGIMAEMNKLCAGIFPEVHP